MQLWKSPQNHADKVKFDTTTVTILSKITKHFHPFQFSRLLFCCENWLILTEIENWDQFSQWWLSFHKTDFSGQENSSVDLCMLLAHLHWFSQVSFLKCLVFKNCEKHCELKCLGSFQPKHLSVSRGCPLLAWQVCPPTILDTTFSARQCNGSVKFSVRNCVHEG